MEVSSISRDFASQISAILPLVLDDQRAGLVLQFAVEHFQQPAGGLVAAQAAELRAASAAASRAAWPVRRCGGWCPRSARSACAACSRPFFPACGAARPAAPGRPAACRAGVRARAAPGAAWPAPLRPRPAAGWPFLDFQLGLLAAIRAFALGPGDDLAGFGFGVAAAQAIEQLDAHEGEHRRDGNDQQRWQQDSRHGFPHANGAARHRGFGGAASDRSATGANPPASRQSCGPEAGRQRRQLRGSPLSARRCWSIARQNCSGKCWIRFRPAGQRRQAGTRNARDGLLFRKCRGRNTRTLAELRSRHNPCSSIRAGPPRAIDPDPTAPMARNQLLKIRAESNHGGVLDSRPRTNRKITSKYIVVANSRISLCLITRYRAVINCCQPSWRQLPSGNPKALLFLFSRRECSERCAVHLGQGPIAVLRPVITHRNARLHLSTLHPNTVRADCNRFKPQLLGR